MQNILLWLLVLSSSVLMACEHLNAVTDPVEESTAIGEEISVPEDPPFVTDMPETPDVTEDVVDLPEETPTEDTPVEVAQPEIPIVDPPAIEEIKPVVEIHRPQIFSRPGKFQRVKILCSVFQEADEKSKIFNQINEGRKLWMERVNDDWRMVYTKIGPAFVKAECFAEKPAPLTPVVEEIAPAPQLPEEEPAIVAGSVEEVQKEEEPIVIALIVVGYSYFRRRRLDQELRAAFTQF